MKGEPLARRRGSGRLAKDLGSGGLSGGRVALPKKRRPASAAGWAEWDS